MLRMSNEDYCNIINKTHDSLLEIEGEKTAVVSFEFKSEGDRDLIKEIYERDKEISKLQNNWINLQKWLTKKSKETELWTEFDDVLKKMGKIEKELTIENQDKENIALRNKLNKALMTISLIRMERDTSIETHKALDMVLKDLIGE